jgi:hypothetical protein
MNRCAFVITHHKTGSTLTIMTFRSICRALKIRFIDIATEDVQLSTIVPPVVVFDRNCSILTGKKDFAKFTPLLLNSDHRMFHLIRDPRDVVVSAVHYHRTSGEKWLHVPEKRYGGLTYQQKLNAFGDETSRYLFEMENSSGRVIEQMRQWNYGIAHCFECKYEDLVVDTEMTLFADVVAHLGFSKSEIEECRKRFWQFSLFGGHASRKGKTQHIRSGEARQWRNAFNFEIANHFIARFDDVLVRLGYEPDNSWLERFSRTISDRP